jgi:hypothetical protein
VRRTASAPLLTIAACAVDEEGRELPPWLRDVRDDGVTLRSEDGGPDLAVALVSAAGP